MNIIGISAYYHDSAACLLQDGVIIAAAQEERFTRIKHDPGFPTNALRYCLEEAGITIEDIDHVCFYDKPLLKFERLLETYLSFAPAGIRSFIAAMPIWLKEKLFLKRLLRQELSALAGDPKTPLPPLLFNQHHRSHAASTYFPSPFDEAAVMCLDGVGEWATSSVWVGSKNTLTHQWEIQFPHSLGLLYSAFTYYTGFKVNSGEYKLMGLAPYGEPSYVDVIRDSLLDIANDGTFKLDMRYFDFATGLRMTNKRFDQLFGGPPRDAESEITQKEMDIARSIQVVTEEIVLRLANTVQSETGQKNLCLAGGVALNCVANGRLVRESKFDNIWIQPAAGDAGGAIGAAYSIWHEYLDNPRQTPAQDAMAGSYLGPAYGTEEIKAALDQIGASYERYSDHQFYPFICQQLAAEKVVGWFQGRMEFGPRALGGRSIIGDPRSEKMQSVMNLKIKYRESFRPFAPAVKAEAVSDWFDHQGPSPYMLVVAPVKSTKRRALSDHQDGLFGIDKLKIPRSEIPAVTHVDYSARVQTVHKDTNPRFYHLLDEFEQQTGCAVLINTSFNVRGEPIVCAPEDAYRCFMRTEMDYLVLEDFVLAKGEQPAYHDNSNWQQEFALD